MSSEAVRTGNSEGAMVVEPECFPCFLRQVVIALDLAGAGRELKERVIKGVLPEIEAAETAKPPAYATTFIHRKVREMLGTDPFGEVKSRYNSLAMGMYGRMKRLVDDSEDPLGTALRLAVSGNVIDFGIFTEVDIEGAMQRALGSRLEVDDSEALRKELGGTESVLYLLDNSGEIVFDRALIETIVSFGKSVTAVVKGSPVINDATMKDAQQCGLPEVCEVVENGSDAVGTILEMSKPEFAERFYSAPLVISKGQGNYETLLASGRQGIYFILQAKCGVVGRHLGLPVGSMLIKGHRA